MAADRHEPTEKTPTRRLAAPPTWPGILAVTLVALPCIAVSQFIVHLDDAILDDHLFAYFGWCLNEGATLYRDVWDHKPPGTIWLNAFGFFVDAGAGAGVIAICFLAQVGAIACFAIAASMLYQRGTAALLTVLAAIYLTHSSFFGGSNRGESYIVTLDLLLLVCYLFGWKHRHWKWWLAAGCFGGASILMKQTGAAALLAILIHLTVLCIAGHVERRKALRQLRWLLAGATAILLMAATVLAMQGTLGEAWRAVVTFNRTFVAIETAGPGESAWWWTRLDRSGLPLLKLPLLLAAASLVHAAATHFYRRNETTEARTIRRPLAELHSTTLLSGWLLTASVAAMAGPTHSTHYMLPVMPPLLLLGGRIIDQLLGEAALLERIARRASVLIALFVIAYLATDALLAQAQKASTVYWERNPRRDGLRWHVEPTSAELIGRKIRELTEPSETVLCWDYLPAVLLEARRRNASRFPTHGLFTIGRQAGICEPDEYHAAIVAKNPAVIFMSSRSRRQLEAAGNDPSSEAHPEARLILDRYEYRPGLTRGDIELFTRRVRSDR